MLPAFSSCEPSKPQAHRGGVGDSDKAQREPVTGGTCWEGKGGCPSHTHQRMQVLSLHLLVSSPSEGLGPGSSPYLLSPQPLPLPPGPARCLDVTRSEHSVRSFPAGPLSLQLYVDSRGFSINRAPHGRGAAQDQGQELFSVASLVLKEETEYLGFKKQLSLVWFGGGKISCF